MFAAAIIALGFVGLVYGGSSLLWADIPASIAAAAAMLFRIWPRLAAHLEAAMPWIITLLVWVPRVAAAPGEQEGWSELAVSCAIAAGTWIVADTYRAVDRVATGRRSAALPRDSLP